jgi:Tol biopolymer transport system component
MAPVTQRLSSGLFALSLLSSGCFRTGYELLELEALPGDGSTGGVPPGAALPVRDAGVLLSEPRLPDAGSAEASPLQPNLPPDAATALDCDWGEPTLLSLPGTEGAQLFGGPHLSADGSTLYFSMQLSGSSEDLYVATRSVPGGAFAAPVPLTEVNSSSADGSPFVTVDGTSIYFFSQRGGPAPTARDLFVATRSTTAEAFGTPTVLAGVNSSQLDQAPHLTSDGLELWLGSHRGNTGFEDVYVARRARTTDTFSAPTAVAELNSTGRDTGAALSVDALTVYYSSERTGTQGGFDLWQARRTSRAAPFSNVEALRELNGRDDEFDPSLSADESELVFVSNRGGSIRLWHSTRDCQ